MSMLFPDGILDEANSKYVDVEDFKKIISGIEKIPWHD